jgi:hypothetical protein
MSGRLRQLWLTLLLTLCIFAVLVTIAYVSGILT